MKYNSNDHTFVICAYKESKYIEECIKSLLNQSVKSNILVSTSTPNDTISSLCEKYNLKLYINYGKQSIADDWNFGYNNANTKLVTIAHQDDIYENDYLKEILNSFNNTENPLISFTDYYEIRNSEKIYDNKLLKIKRFLLTPIKIFNKTKSKFIKRSIIAFGNSICCPSVTLVKENIGDNLFKFGYKSDIDWQAWEELSKMKGEFVFVDKYLMGHRIHVDSETSNVLQNNGRIKEDYEMFCRFWIKPIAKILTKYYSNSAKSNDL